MESYLTNTYLFCLHRDEKDLSKLRLIGVPTALQRIITNHIAQAYRRKFAFDLLPFNYAIGIDSSQLKSISPASSNKARPSILMLCITRPQEHVQ